MGIAGLLAQAYDAHAPGLFRYALMLVANSPSAEDAVAITFLKLAGMGQRLLKIQHMDRYLRLAVRNECYTLMSRHKADKTASDQQAILQAIAPSGSGLDEEERLAVEDALRSLPPEQREIVCLRIYEGVSFDQIAERLDIAIGTAASRYRYAIEKLRARLKKHFKEA
jgi:RNA polymerase sigma-70 factor (ECF subfamily)